jgi:hypothetical protein
MISNTWCFRKGKTKVPKKVSDFQGQGKDGLKGKYGIFPGGE